MAHIYVLYLLYKYNKSKLKLSTNLDLITEAIQPRQGIAH